jgi:hypothetical protein
MSKDAETDTRKSQHFAGSLTKMNFSLGIARPRFHGLYFY